MLSTSQAEAPGALRSLDSSELGWLTVGHATVLGISVAAACLAIGFTAFLGVLPRLFLSLGALIALGAWVATQNLGGILTGSGADVGTGPVLILLALAFWPLAATRPPLAGPRRERRRGAVTGRTPARGAAGGRHRRGLADRGYSGSW